LQYKLTVPAAAHSSHSELPAVCASCCLPRQQHNYCTLYCWYTVCL